jgi:hypothetical protein
VLSKPIPPESYEKNKRVETDGSERRVRGGTLSWPSSSQGAKRQSQRRHQIGLPFARAQRSYLASQRNNVGVARDRAPAGHSRVLFQGNLGDRGHCVRVVLVDVQVTGKESTDRIDLSRSAFQKDSCVGVLLSIQFYVQGASACQVEDGPAKRQQESVKNKQEEESAMVIPHFAQAAGSDGMTTSDDTAWIPYFVTLVASREVQLKTQCALAHQLTSET